MTTAPYWSLWEVQVPVERVWWVEGGERVHPEKLWVG